MSLIELDVLSRALTGASEAGSGVGGASQPLNFGLARDIDQILSASAYLDQTSNLRAAQASVSLTWLDIKVTLAEMQVRTVDGAEALRDHAVRLRVVPLVNLRHPTKSDQWTDVSAEISTDRGNSVVLRVSEFGRESVGMRLRSLAAPPSKIYVLTHSIIRPRKSGMLTFCVNFAEQIRPG